MKYKEKLTYLRTSYFYVIPLIITYLINLSRTSSDSKLVYAALNKEELFKEILYKNTFCFLFVLSALIFGKYLIYLFLIVNGSLLGSVIGSFSNPKYLFLILPHGILEMVTYIYISYLVLLLLRNDAARKKDIANFFFSYLFIIIAALIEAFITTKLVVFI